MSLSLVVTGRAAVGPGYRAPDVTLPGRFAELDDQSDGAPPGAKVMARMREATEFSLEEQQSHCIARLLPVQSSVLLMDEPYSALGPTATKSVAELLPKLRGAHSILIVTHNMAQARRANDECIFMLIGKVSAHSRTGEVLITPRCQEAAEPIKGRYG